MRRAGNAPERTRSRSQSSLSHWSSSQTSATLYRRGASTVTAVTATREAHRRGRRTVARSRPIYTAAKGNRRVTLCQLCHETAIGTTGTTAKLVDGQQDHKNFYESVGLVVVEWEGRIEVVCLLRRDGHRIGQGGRQWGAHTFPPSHLPTFDEYNRGPWPRGVSDDQSSTTQSERHG